MNLLCPNCQKMLTVPEHAAGQQMGCPLCNGKFTVPNAPPPVVSDPAPAPAPPAPTPSPNTYGLAPEPQPAFSSPPSPPPSKAEPAFTTTPAPKPVASTPTPQPSSTSPGDYTRTVHLTINEQILQWVPVAAVGLVFFLLFFPWVGVYPGGVAAVTQNGWQAPFGGYTPDPDMKDHFKLVPDSKDEKTGQLVVGNEPGWDPLCLFYLLFLLATLVFTCAVVAQPFLKGPLPPKVQQVFDQLMPFKKTILAGLNAALLLFLALQLLLSFSLESRFRAWVEAKPSVKREAGDTSIQQKEKDVTKGKFLHWMHRTFWLRLVFLLHLIAAVTAGLIYWLERRGPGKPTPYLELRW